MKKRLESSCPKKVTRERYNLKGKRPILITSLLAMGIFFTLFTFFPIGYALVGSFHEWNPMVSIFNFVGWENYVNVFNDNVFWLSLWNTMLFMIIVTFARLVISLILSVLIEYSGKLKGFFRTTYFIPVVTSMVAVAIIWKWFYDANNGLFNQILSMVGLPELSWLINPNLAIYSLMIMTIWKDCGYAIVILLAGLGGIPSSIVEAAGIDGATKPQIFWKITLPLLRPTILFLMVTSVIGYIQTFSQMFIITKGGPMNATSTVVYMLYQKAFESYEFGIAAAISFIVFIIIGFFTFIQFKVMNNNEGWEY